MVSCQLIRSQSSLLRQLDSLVRDDLDTAGMTERPGECLIRLELRDRTPEVLESSKVDFKFK